MPTVQLQTYQAVLFYPLAVPFEGEFSIVTQDIDLRPAKLRRLSNQYYNYFQGHPPHHGCNANINISLAEGLHSQPTPLSPTC